MTFYRGIALSQVGQNLPLFGTSESNQTLTSASGTLGGLKS